LVARSSAFVLDVSKARKAGDDRPLRDAGPLGPALRAGSWEDATIRRIVLAEGVLVLREPVHICQTASGPVGTGTWEVVDSAPSTGIFAGARGSGDDTIDIANRTSTLSGKLNLAGSEDEAGSRVSHAE
jgi:hypothetical protein